MEELPTHRSMKGILDRSFVLKFLIGNPQYNIKDVLRSAGEPEFKPLYDELIDARKLLFCWRLLHYEDPILDVKLNIKNRSAELTKPLIRLFQNSPIALERILDSLSKLMVERNEVKKGSFESKLYDVIDELRKERKERFDRGIETDEDAALREHGPAFTNKTILEKTIELMDCKETEKPNIFWSLEAGCLVSQTKITNTSKSKFKAKSDSVRIGNKTYRYVKFEEEHLERIKSIYDIPDKIEIKNVTPVTGVTLPGKTLPPNKEAADAKITPKVKICSENLDNNDENNTLDASFSTVNDHTFPQRV